MGADYVVAIAPMEVDADEAVMNLVALSDEAAITAVSVVLGMEDVTANEARLRIATAIHAIVGVERRDVDPVRFEGQAYVTGGLSWGDSPTAAFDEVALLGAAGVTAKQPVISEHNARDCLLQGHEVFAWWDIPYRHAVEIREDGTVMVLT
ncbi:MAG: hypothetical protein DRJ50_04010, partial [Actinobacteria bacterium]